MVDQDGFPSCYEVHALMLSCDLDACRLGAERETEFLQGAGGAAKATAPTAGGEITYDVCVAL